MRFLFASGLVLAAIVAAVVSCNSEILEKQAQQIKEQQAELARQRKEIDELLANQQIQDQKQRDCNRAFRDYFEKAQNSADTDKAITLYREGLTICPDDEIAHYELGKTLAAGGRTAEAEKEFEAALKSNPDFLDAKARLETLRKGR
jgi:tetratricopeptide (TPR) repeat protein